MGRWGIYLFSGGLYTALFYATDRTNFVQLISIWMLLSALYAYILYQEKAWQYTILQETTATWSKGIYELVGCAIVFRLIALFALPELSDDYFRFVWDGRLLGNGVNPFDQLPQAYLSDRAYMEQLGLSEALYDNLNSKEYFTIYPPVCQFVFWLSCQLFPHSIYASVICMKAFIFVAECVSLASILYLLQHWKYPLSLIAVYGLNPLVIIELNGNLHFEAFMICFLLLAMVLWVRNQWMWAAVPFALAVCSKLLPLMLLPLMIPRLGLVKSIVFGLLVGAGMLICSLPIFNPTTLQNLMESVSLYFQYFEFNGSIYYVLRWAGFQLWGFNMIQLIGRLLIIISFLGILTISWGERNATWRSTPIRMLWIFSLFYALSTTVHPWYGTTLVMFCTFAGFRYPVLWAILLPLTYSAYIGEVYEEQLWLVGIEYIGVYALCIYEFIKMSKQPNSFLNLS